MSLKYLKPNPRHNELLPILTHHAQPTAHRHFPTAQASPANYPQPSSQAWWQGLFPSRQRNPPSPNQARPAPRDLTFVALALGSLARQQRRGERKRESSESQEQTRLR